MRNILSLTFISVVFLFACNDHEAELQAFMNDIQELHTSGDSISGSIKTDMRTINLQISEMIDNGVNIDLLGSFVDAYKEKERKYNTCKSSWEEVYNTVNSAKTPEFSNEEIERMREQAKGLNDSLKTLSSEMARIHSQAMTIIQETREKNSEDRPTE